MNNILEVKKLCKDYGSFKLTNVSFELPRGYIMGFVGPNGAGKTTTVKLILDVINSDGGSVKCEANNKIGVVMDSPLYVEDWTVRDVERAVAPFYEEWDSEKFGGLIKTFGLDSKKKVKDLSRSTRCCFR